MSKIESDLTQYIQEFEQARKNLLAVYDTPFHPHKNSFDLAMQPLDEAIKSFRVASAVLFLKSLKTDKMVKAEFFRLLDLVVATYQHVAVSLNLDEFKKEVDSTCKTYIRMDIFRDLCITYMVSLIQPKSSAKDHEGDLERFLFLLCNFAVNPTITMGNGENYGYQLLTYAIEKRDCDDFLNTMLEYVGDNKASIVAAPLAYGALRGQTPLFLACRYNNLGAVKILVEAGANPLQKLPANGTLPHRTPFHEAVMRARLKIVRYFLDECKVDVHFLYENVAAIHHAIGSGEKAEMLEVVRCLLDHGANPREIATKLPHRGIHALGLCVLNGHSDLFDVIIDRDEMAYQDKVHTRYNAKNAVTLEYIARNGDKPQHKVILEKLLALKAKYEPEKVAKEKRQEELHRMRELLNTKNPAPLKLCSDFLRTMEPLHYCAQTGNLASLRILVEDLKMDPNSRNRDQNTPLHLATAKKHADIVGFLVQSGANTDLTNASELTALDIADAKRSEACVAHLIPESMTFESAMIGKQETVFRVMLQRASESECRAALPLIQNPERFLMIAKKLVALAPRNPSILSYCVAQEKFDALREILTFYEKHHAHLLSSFKPLMDSACGLAKSLLQEAMNRDEPVFEKSSAVQPATVKVRRENHPKTDLSKEKIQAKITQKKIERIEKQLRKERVKKGEDRLPRVVVEKFKLTPPQPCPVVYVRLSRPAQQVEIQEVAQPKRALSIVIPPCEDQEGLGFELESMADLLTEETDSREPVKHSPTSQLEIPVKFAPLGNGDLFRFLPPAPAPIPIRRPIASILDPQAQPFDPKSRGTSPN